MAPSGGVLAPMALRALRHALKKATNLVKQQVASVARPLEQELQPILARNAPKQPLHPLARIRQGKGRWYTTQSNVRAAVRRYMSTLNESSARYDRASFPTSSTATAVSRLTCRAPFASTLRPNLTGGAIPRTAGGYGLGGGVGTPRYFSHTPTAPAQIVNNVSAACRAFWLSGHMAEFNGMTTAGEKRFRAVSGMQKDTCRTMRSMPKNAPGSFVDFQLSPTITALGHIGTTQAISGTSEPSTTTLNTEGFLDVLSIDFSRALKDLAVITGDLRKLSALGDLPISIVDRSILRVQFPGCDANSVEHLCDEVGVQRGIIHQDSNFMQAVGGEVALKFPFASMSEHTMSSPGGSLRSQTSDEHGVLDDFENPWAEGYESMEGNTEQDEDSYHRLSQIHSSTEYEGIEGIYRFLEQCDGARRIIPTQSF